MRKDNNHFVLTLYPPLLFAIPHFLVTTTLFRVWLLYWYCCWYHPDSLRDTRTHMT